MQNIFEKYIHSISSKFEHKETSEMGYRTDFENLLKEIFESINVKRIDHDAKAKDGNKPDFVIVSLIFLFFTLKQKILVFLLIKLKNPNKWIATLVMQILF